MYGSFSLCHEQDTSQNIETFTLTWDEHTQGDNASIPKARDEKASLFPILKYNPVGDCV